MLAAILTVWLGVWGPIDLTKIKEWQPLTSAAVAAVGITITAIIAVRNVTRQIRISILSREEDRIEKEAPGLRDARNFLSSFLHLRSVATFLDKTDTFRRDGFGIVGSTFQKDVLLALPNTDRATRLQIERRLVKVFSLARAAEAIERKIKQSKEMATLQSSQLDRERDEQIARRGATAYLEGMSEIEAEIHNIDRKIARYEVRSNLIRNEIEAYFGDE